MLGERVDIVAELQLGGSPRAAIRSSISMDNPTFCGGSSRDHRRFCHHYRRHITFVSLPNRFQVVLMVIRATVQFFLVAITPRDIVLDNRLSP
jgi:hypothetical protein